VFAYKCCTLGYIIVPYIAHHLVCTLIFKYQTFELVLLSTKFQLRHVRISCHIFIQQQADNYRNTYTTKTTT